MTERQLAGVYQEVRGFGLAAALVVAGAAGIAMLEAAADPEAAKVKNPTPVSEASLAAGQTVYNKSCRPCHSRDGGGGAPGPSLIDDEWRNGSTDGEIYAVIRKGVVDTRMEAWDDRVSEADTWNLVNYIRSLKPQVGK